MAFFTIQKQQENAENIKKCEKFVTNIEAGLLAILKDLMTKFGQPFTDFLKAILECSICKGLITKVSYLLYA